MENEHREYTDEFVSGLEHNLWVPMVFRDNIVTWHFLHG